MGAGVTLLGSQPYQRTASASSSEYTPAVVVHDPEVVLGAGVTLLGSQPVPAHSFGLVLRYAPAVVVHDTEFVLGRSVALLSVNEEPSHRCGIVATVISCHSFVKCLPRRDWRAGQRSQQRQGDNAAPNQSVLNAVFVASAGLEHLGLRLLESSPGPPGSHCRVHPQGAEKPPLAAGAKVSLRPALPLPRLLLPLPDRVHTPRNTPAISL